MINKLILVFSIVAFLALSGCTGTDFDSESIQPIDSVAHSADVPDSMMGAPSATGAVVETMDSAGYTYVKIDTGSGEVWAAGPQTVVEVGDIVSVSGSIMPGFSSASLGRTFDEIIFADKIIVSGGTESSTDSAPSPHGSVD